MVNQSKRRELEAFFKKISDYVCKRFCVTLQISDYKNFFQMALQSKTFRTSDDVIKALKDKVTELDISESDIINKAFRCFLGLGIDNDCDTSQTEFNILKNRLEKLIEINNLKEA